MAVTPMTRLVQTKNILLIIGVLRKLSGYFLICKLPIDFANRNTKIPKTRKGTNPILKNHITLTLKLTYFFPTESIKQINCCKSKNQKPLIHYKSLYLTVIHLIFASVNCERISYLK